MPIFPEMPLPAFGSEDGPGPGLPAGATSGVMPGLNNSLIHLLGNFSPGPLGVCVVEEALQLSLPIPDWASWTYAYVGETTMASGLAVFHPVVTVPEDERWKIIRVWTSRTSGDNTLAKLIVDYPASYCTTNSDREILLLSLATAATALFYPDPGLTQTLNTTEGQMPWERFICEPGSVIGLLPAGVGVAATVFDYKLMVERTKIYRVMPPAG